MKRRAENKASERERKPRGKPFVKGNKVGFKPGQSGNPGGRPMAEKEVAAAIRLRGQELVDALMSAALKENVAAIREAFDRSIGKAKERIELTGVDGGPVHVTTDVLRALPVEKLEQLRAILKSAEPSAQTETPSAGSLPKPG